MRDFTGFKEQLLTLRTELDARVGGIKNDMAKLLDHDFAEQAVELENGEVLDALGTEAVEEISEINNALMRIEEGDYGNCLDCNAEIPMARLIARPYSSCCIACAQKREAPARR